jgi:hypothetical protein
MVTFVLPSHNVIGVERPHRLQQTGLLVSRSLMFFVGRRIHGEVSENLQHVILHNITNRARLVVKFSSVPHAKIFGHRDLNRAQIIAIPDRFQHWIRKTGVKNVLYRLLSEVMINAKDVFLWKIVREYSV